MDESDVIHMFCHVRKQGTHPLARVPILLKFPARLDNPATVSFAAATKRFHIDRFAVHPNHPRFVVKRVDVTRSAVHEQKDDRLCFGLMVWNPWGKRVDKFSAALCANGFAGKETVSAEHGSQRNRSESPAGLPQEFTPGSPAKSVSFI